MQLRDPLSTSINFACGRDIFPQVPSNFCVAGRTIVNFRKLSIRPVDLLSTFYAARRPSLNFRQFLCSQETFREDLSTFGAARKPTVNFLQLSVRPGDIPLDFIKILCGQQIFCQLPSTFHLVRRSSVNFCQFSMQPGDLP